MLALKALVVALAGVAVAAFFAAVPQTQANVVAQNNTPTTTVSPGPGTQYLGPHLWGILNQRASKQTVPNNIDMELHVRSDSTLSESLADHVTRVGGSNVATNIWRVPTSKALTIVHRSDVYYAKLSPSTMADSSSTRDSVRRTTISHLRLDDTLDSVATGYANSSVTDADAAKYALFADGGNVLVEIQISSATRRTSVRNWLRQRSVHYLTPAQTGNVYSMAVLLPVSRVKALADAYSDINLRAPSPGDYAMDMDRSQWTQAQRDASDALVATYRSDYTLPTETAETSTGRPWEVDLTTRREQHGVDKWLGSNLNLDGSGVKVGIIDWSFTGINDVRALPILDIATSFTDTSGNAFCQPIIEGVMAEGLILFSSSTPCQAIAGVFFEVRHGVNIAELVHDMAPDAELVYAQANSPRQLYDATRWMVAEDVDVIVNAAGWNYDNLDNGVATFGQSTYDTTPPALSNEHSSYRYYPSPNATVDYAVTNGIVWVNAAGNQDEWTLRMKDEDYSLNLSRNSEYYGYVIFNPDEADADGQTCQEIDVRAFSQNLYSLRWADTVPQGAHRVELILERQTFPFQGTLVNTTFAPEQFPNNYPVRKFNALSVNGVDLCLRIRVRPEGNNHPVEPEWIQFQVLSSRGGDANAPDWAFDSSLPNSMASGHSIVNPSDSDNPGMLAVGAWDIREAGASPTDYSSRGPVYNETSNVLSSKPSRSKPDVVASTEVATYTKWRWDCDRDANDCDDLYFEGTSGATGQTGGIAALAVGWFKKSFSSFTAGNVADYLRSSAINKGPSNEWGHGLIKLPCPSNWAGTVGEAGYWIAGQWDGEDCASDHDTALHTRRSDYYTFKIEAESDVVIGLYSYNRQAYDSDLDPHIYLSTGTHHRGDDLEPGGRGVESVGGFRIALLKEEGLAPGHYTVEVTTAGENDLRTADADVEYLFIVRAVPTEPHTSTVGIQNPLDSGGSSDFVVRADRLTAGHTYTVSLESSNAQVGFDRECGQATSQGFRANAPHRHLKFTVYSCGQAASTRTSAATSSSTNVTVKLRRGGTSGTVLDTDAHTVSVSAPTLSRPPAPNSVSAGSPSRSAITVSWSAVTNAARYRVQYRRGNVGGWRTATSSATGTSHRVAGLNCGATYQFRVAAYGDGTNHLAGWGSTRSASARTSSCLSLAPAPGNVRTSGVQKYSVLTAWNPVSGTTKYRVQYQAGSSGSWRTATSTATGTSHRVTGLDCETGYRFRVQAYGNGTSWRPTWGHASSPVTVTTSPCPPPAPAPAIPTLLTPDRNTAVLIWNAGPVGVAHWRVEHREGATGAWTIYDQTVSASSVNIYPEIKVMGLDCDTAYQFRVSAYGDGEIYRFAYGPASPVKADSTTSCEKPGFIEHDTSHWIPAAAPVGTIVDQASAWDDTPDDVLRYRITGGNAGNVFAIDSSSGLLTTRAALGSGPYALTLEVKDRLNQTGLTTRTVHVNKTYTAAFEFDNYLLEEGGEPVAVKVILDRPAEQPISVSVTTGGDLDHSDDIAGPPLTLDFAIGESFRSFLMSSPADEDPEGFDSLTISIGGGESRGRILPGAPSTAVVDIEDDAIVEYVLWETTLTVGYYYFTFDVYGYSEAVRMDGNPDGSLGSQTFDWYGTEYKVTDLFFTTNHIDNSGNRISIAFNRDLPSDVSQTFLQVGSTKLDLSNPDEKSTNFYKWLTPDLTWSAGDTVKVRLFQKQAPLSR